MTKNKLLILSASALFLSGCSLLPKSFSLNSSQSKGDQAKSALRLSNIIANGGTASCTITNIEDKQVTTMAVSGKKMKITGSSVDTQGQKGGSYLTDGTYVYIWEQGKKEGIKMKLPSEDEAKETADKAKDKADNSDYDPSAYSSQYEDDTKFNMDCKEGSIPQSEFEPPTDVTFTDFQSMMQESLKAIPSLPAMDDYNY